MKLASRAWRGEGATIGATSLERHYFRIRRICVVTVVRPVLRSLSAVTLNLSLPGARLPMRTVVDVGVRLDETLSFFGRRWATMLSPRAITLRPLTIVTLRTPKRLPLFFHLILISTVWMLAVMGIECTSDWPTALKESVSVAG